ncbi:hypothetical protein DY000_02015984 [Brassica cretica]|uniref:Uncharacterized protein n=1 Tax=Brassica cretica TaxID=69181 RepID=A0ABQ7DB62_BRACR|nr:hypothetical protein DY000_02015984 [Brassica cretica]
MHVLLYSGQYALREEAVEEIKDCRSITQHWCRSTVTPEHWLSIFQDRLKPRSHTKYIHLSTRNNNEERISGFFKEGACWFMHNPVKEAGTEGTTSTSTDDTTSTSTDGTTSISIDSTISTSTNDTTSTSIDDSTHKSTDVSSCSPSLDVEKGITMEDSLELEEFLELEDGEKLEDLDSSREVTMEYFLELEEWLEDMDQNLKKKLDDDQHTSRGDLETSKSSIDRHQPDGIDRQPPHIIDLHPPNIDRHRQPLIDRHHPPNIDRCPMLDVPPCCIIEMEPIEERMYMSKASHLAVPKHQRPPIWIEETAVKTVVPCAVFEAESPIPPDRSLQFSSHIEVLDDHQHIEASLRGLRFTDEVDKGPTEVASVNTDQIPSIDTNTSPLIDTTTASSIDSGRVSEQKDFNVCGNLRDEDTTTRSDKSGGKKRRNWKKRKRIKDGPQVKGKDPRKTSLDKDRRWLRNIDRQSVTSIDRTPLNCVDRQSLKSIDIHLTVLVGTHTKVRFRDDLEESGDFSVFWSLLSTELHRRSFEVDFECHRFEVNQHPVAEVMHVLLKSGQYALREEAVEEIKDC